MERLCLMYQSVTAYALPLLSQTLLFTETERKLEARVGEVQITSAEGLGLL